MTVVRTVPFAGNETRGSAIIAKATLARTSALEAARVIEFGVDLDALVPAF